MSVFVIVLISLGVAAFIGWLFLLYCMTSGSDRKSDRVISSVLCKGFYIILALAIIFGFGYYLHSCSSEAYDRGYEAGYEAGIDAGISLVKEDPAAYLNW